jgi:hypothetical protein
MFQLQSSHHHDPYVTSRKGYHTPVVHTKLKIIVGKYLGLTYKGISKPHIKKHLLYERNLIKFSNYVI